MTEPNIIGCFENISIPSIGVENVIAKIDTGAFSGAVHATGMKVYKRGLDGTRVLKFHPLGDKDKLYETTDFEERHVRSATGHRVKRYLINVDVELHGGVYQAMIGLSDRRKMVRPVLIGRRFLRDNNIIVDVRINQDLDTDYEGEATE